MKSGIYQIRNLINNKIYIGSASYFNSRFARHRFDLKNNRHHSIVLQRAWNKYSEQNFVFEVLFTCPISELIRLEQYFLNNYNPEYNICSIAGRPTGYKHSELSIEKLKLKAQERGKKWSKKVYQIHPETGDVIKEYPSISSICKEFNLSHSMIDACVNKDRKFAANYCWSFVENYSKEKILEIIDKSHHYCKSIIQYDLDLNIIQEYSSIKEAALFFNVNHANISSALRRLNGKAAGYIWKYKNEISNGTEQI